MGFLGCSGPRFGRGGCVDGGVVAGGMSLVSLWRGSSSTCLRVFVVVVWLVFVGGLGGIATIGAALRRVVGVSGVYGRKTPRMVAQSAVHLGEMRVTWGFWGVVDHGLGAVVGLMGEWWPVCAQAGPLGGGVDGVPGLPLVGLTCAVEGLVLPPDTPSDHLRCPGRQVRSGRPTGAELPPLPPLPASPEPRVGQDVSGNI